MSGAKEVQQTSHSGVSEAGQQVPLLEGPGPSAAPQRQKLGSKDFSGPSVDDALHYSERSPKTQKDDLLHMKSWQR